MRMLREALREVLSEEEAKCLYGAFDIVGDIAVIKVPDILMPKKHLVAEVILQKVKAVKTVLRQSTPVEGDYRVRGLEWIGGEERTETLYREHGCVFKVDLSKVYFSPRLSTERLRIADQVKPGEYVVNLFGGVGTFSIIIAKKQKDSRGFTIDINPEAHRLAIENIRLNKVGDKVTPILGDARNAISESLRGKADRALMPLPEEASKYLEDALLALKPTRGIIHYYTHVHGVTRREAVKEAEKQLEGGLKEPHRIVCSKVVREVGPRWYQVVCDIEVAKEE